MLWWWKLTNPKQDYIYIDHNDKKILQKVAKIKRWKTAELLRFFAEMFKHSLDLINDEKVDIETLREYYRNWELGIYPEGVGNVEW